MDGYVKSTKMIFASFFTIFILCIIVYVDGVRQLDMRKKYLFLEGIVGIDNSDSLIRSDPLRVRHLPFIFSGINVNHSVDQSQMVKDKSRGEAFISVSDYFNSPIMGAYFISSSQSILLHGVLEPNILPTLDNRECFIAYFDITGIDIGLLNSIGVAMSGDSIKRAYFSKYSHTCNNFYGDDEIILIITESGQKYFGLHKWYFDKVFGDYDNLKLNSLLSMEYKISLQNNVINNLDSRVRKFVNIDDKVVFVSERYLDNVINMNIFDISGKYYGNDVKSGINLLAEYVNNSRISSESLFGFSAGVGDVVMSLPVICVFLSIVLINRSMVLSKKIDLINIPWYIVNYNNKYELIVSYVYLSMPIISGISCFILFSQYFHFSIGIYNITAGGVIGLPPVFGSIRALSPYCADFYLILFLVFLSITIYSLLIINKFRLEYRINRGKFNMNIENLFRAN